MVSYYIALKRSNDVGVAAVRKMFPVESGKQMFEKICMEKHQDALHPKGTLIPTRKKKSHSTVFQINIFNPGTA